MTSPATAPHHVSVRGGSGGIEAHYDDMVAAARLFGAAASDLGSVAFTLHGVLADSGMLAGGVFDPAGCASFELELLGALDGPGGVTWLAVRCAAVDVALRAAAAAYEAGDRALTTAHTELDGLLALPHATLAAVGAFTRTGSADTAMNTFATQDPALADDMVLVVGGVRGPLVRAAGDVMRDGSALVADEGVEAAPPAAQPPRNITDLLRALSRRDETEPGAVDVRLLTRADGTRAAIVDIPGTKSWQPLPTADVTSLVTDVRAIAGRNTAYEQGVLRALDLAGVRRTDEVMLVGHSEGGMVAVQTAIDATRSRSFHITHVVTAGAPIGELAAHVPRGVQVLAIENAHDVVPHLDGRTNADRVNVTTCTIDRDTGRVVGNHELASAYLPGAADVDASADPSVRAFLDGARGYLDATSVETHRFLITRH